MQTVCTLIEEFLAEGGPGSGLFGYRGRPGQRGGSLTKGAAAPADAALIKREAGGRPISTRRGRNPP